MLTTAGLLAFVLLPGVQQALGLLDYGRWFLDSYAILASNDAMRAGLDTAQSNPLDVLHRSHVYSGWWFALGSCGLTREDNFLVGGLWVLGFLAVAGMTLRPRSMREAVWMSVLMLSPPVLLAVNRANNDLVIFALLGIAGLTLVRPGRTGMTIASAAIAVAMGLKLYPAVAACVFGLLRPRRRLVTATALLAGLLVIVGLSIWGDFMRIHIPAPTGMYTFGAKVLLREVGWTGHLAHGGIVAVFVIVGYVLQRHGWTRGLGQAGDPAIGLFVIGAAVLVGCFLAGVSFGYRWIFALWTAPWLWQQAHDLEIPQRQRQIAYLAVWLLPVVLWVDGFFCALVNLFAEAVASDLVDQWELIWRGFTQSLVWLFMGLLAGWLAELLVNVWRMLQRGESSHVTKY
ncbi:MAG: DUF2029 domain-containing protein [Opitutae bacterium]|nr:DUF2029 domain-containing protein [Opitutae bacterium]